MLGVADDALHRGREILAQGQGLLQAEPSPPDQVRDDALGLGPGPGRGLLGRERRLAQGLRRRPQPDDPGQDLPGDPGGALLEALEDHLGQDHGGDVLAGLLVHDPDLAPFAHGAVHVLEGHVAPGRRVVQLAVGVALQEALMGAQGLVHAPNITQCVIAVKWE